MIGYSTLINCLKNITAKHLLILSCLLSMGCYAQADDALSCLNAVKAGEYATALNMANTLINKNKSDRSAYICKGKALKETGNTEDALATFKQSQTLAISPEEQMAGHTFIGDVHKNARQYEQAMASFNETLKLSQQHRNKRFERVAMNKIGDTFMLMNNPTEALILFKAGDKLALNDNEHADNLERIANAYEALNDQDKAIEFYIKANQKNEATGEMERYADGMLTLGKLYTQSKSYLQAENTLNQLLKLSKEYENAYYEAKSNLYLMRLKQTMGDTKAAEEFQKQSKLLAEKIKAEDLLQALQQ